MNVILENYAVAKILAGYWLARAVDMYRRRRRAGAKPIEAATGIKPKQRMIDPTEIV